MSYSLCAHVRVGTEATVGRPPRVAQTQRHRKCAPFIFVVISALAQIRTGLGERSVLVPV